MTENEDSRFCRIVARTECHHCGNPLPLSAPAQKVFCCECLSEVEIGGQIWGTILEKADEILERLSIGKTQRVKSTINGSDVSLEITNALPACEKCDFSFNVESLENREQNFECTHCGDPASMRPAPKWVSDLYPGAAAIYEVDPRPAGVDGQPSAAVPDTPRPVALGCPSCAANLKITHENKRVTTCEFCDTDIYLPDAVWRRLHPVKMSVPFFIRYTGRTPSEMKRHFEDLAKAEKNAQEVRDRRRELEIEEAEREKAKARLGGELLKGWVWVLALVALMAGGWLGLFHTAANTPDWQSQDTPTVFIVWVVLLVLGVWFTAYAAMQPANTGYENEVSAGFIPTMPMYLAPVLGAVFALIHLIIMGVTASNNKSLTHNRKPLGPMTALYLVIIIWQAPMVTYMVMYGE
jgi:hypothetical protein